MLKRLLIFTFLVLSQPVVSQISIQSSAQPPNEVQLKQEEARHEKVKDLNFELVELQQQRNQAQESLDAIIENIQDVSDDERESLEIRKFQQGQELVNANREVMKNLLEQKANGINIQPFINIESKNLLEINQRIINAIAIHDKKYAEDTNGLDTNSEQYFLYFSSNQDYLNIASALLLDYQEDLATLGLLTDSHKQLLNDHLLARAESLAGQIQILSKEKKIFDSTNLAENDKALADIAAKKFDIITNSFKKTIDLLSDINIDTTDYQEILIAATGTITKDVLDIDVASSLAQTWSKRILKAIDENALDIIFKAILFVVISLTAWVFAKLVGRLLHSSLENTGTRKNNLMQKMVVGLASRFVFFLGILFALSQLGISLGPILTGLGIAGFVIGFALQDTLGNFASGIMILIYRPYDIGDVVDVGDGVFGSVSGMNLVSTTILTFDNQTLVLPNNKIWGNVIKNITDQNVRRVDMTFHAPLNQDVDRMQALFMQCIEADRRINDEPEPLIKVHEISLDSIVFVIRPWVSTEDYWDVYWDFHAAVKRAYDKAGIGFPTHQMTINS